VLIFWLQIEQFRKKTDIFSALEKKNFKPTSNHFRHLGCPRGRVHGSKAPGIPMVTHNDVSEKEIVYRKNSKFLSKFLTF